LGRFVQGSETRTRNSTQVESPKGALRGALFIEREGMGGFGDMDPMIELRWLEIAGHITARAEREINERLEGDGVKLLLVEAAKPSERFVHYRNISLNEHNLMTLIAACGENYGLWVYSEVADQITDDVSKVSFSSPHGTHMNVLIQRGRQLIDAKELVKLYQDYHVSVEEVKRRIESMLWHKKFWDTWPKSVSFSQRREGLWES